MATKKKKTMEYVGNAPTTMKDRPFYGMELDDEQLAFADAILNPKYDIIFVNAKAGVGKTTVATGVANILVKHGVYDEIVYVMAPYGEHKQGWLPGTITEKSSVYFEAFYQSLITCGVNPNQAIHDGSMTQKSGTSYIYCITDTFLRGVTLDRSIIILDEAQNYTEEQLKKILTRIGRDSKVIVIGHDKQCDLIKNQRSGFLPYMIHFMGQERSAVCKLTKNHRSWISQWADELILNQPIEKILKDKDERLEEVK